MINYPKREKTFFNHPESQDGDVRIKILSADVKKGSEVGGMAARGDNANEDYFFYRVMKPDRSEYTWSVKAASQVGGELADKNVQPGDVIKIHYLGEVMETTYGMKPKYQIIKEKKGQPQEQPQENPNLAEDAKEVFGEEVSMDNID